MKDLPLRTPQDWIYLRDTSVSIKPDYRQSTVPHRYTSTNHSIADSGLKTPVRLLKAAEPPSKASLCTSWWTERQKSSSTDQSRRSLSLRPRYS